MAPSVSSPADLYSLSFFTQKPEMEIPPRNCYGLHSSLTWKICGVFCFAKTFFFMYKAFSSQWKGKASCLFLGSPLPSACASMHRQHHPASSLLQGMHSSSSFLGPSLCLASLLSTAFTSSGEKWFHDLLYSNLIAFGLWLQGTPGSESAI